MMLLAPFVVTAQTTKGVWDNASLSLAKATATPASSVIMTTEDSKANGYDDSRKIVRSASGTLFYTTRKKAGTYHQIHVYKSTDNGATWTLTNSGAPIANIASFSARVPSMVIDQNDVLHVVWYQQDATHSNTNERVIKYSRSTDAGNTWSAWVNLAEPTGFPTDGSATYWQEHPIIAVDATNNLYVVWEGRETSSVYNGKVMFMKSTNAGLSWSPYQIVKTGTTSTQSRPTFIATSTALYLFQYSNQAYQGIWMTQSTDGGSTWSAWTAVSQNTSFDARHVSVAATSDDKVHLVWRAFDASSPTVSRIQYSIYDGSSFSTPVSIAPNPSTTAYQIYPQIATDKNNNVLVYWWNTEESAGYPSEEPTSGEVYLSAKAVNTNTWTTPLLLSDGMNHSTWPSMSWSNYFMDTQTAHLTWMVPNGVNYDILYQSILPSTLFSLDQELITDANTSLLLHFNQNAIGDAGETPVLQSGIPYPTGIWCEGALLASGSNLQYTATGNISATSGSFETWIKPTWAGSDGQSHWLLNWGSSGGILFGKDGGGYLRAIFNRYGGAGGSEIGLSYNINSWTANAWYHVAYTWEATKIKMYVNGTLVAETVPTSLPNITATSFQIGADGSGGFANGILDELRISTIPRTENEIITAFWQGMQHRVTVTALNVSPNNVQLAVGNTYPFKASASTSDGKTYPVTPVALWTSNSPSIATITSTGVATGIITGSTNVIAGLGGQTGQQSLTVIPPLVAPSFTATAFKTTVRLTWGTPPSNTAGYHIYRSTTSNGQITPIRTVGAYTAYTDYNLIANTTYYYKLSYFDKFGNESALSNELQVTTNNNNYLKIANLDLLVPIYTTGRTLSNISQLQNTLPLAQRFYFRNSLGKLNLNIKSLEIDGGISGTGEFTNVANDLIGLGILANQYDAIHAFSNNAFGCFGSGKVMGSTGISTSQGTCIAQYPDEDPAYTYGELWSFVHEFGHTLDSPIAHESGFPEMPFNHFPWAYPYPAYATPFDAGPHFDGMARILRTFPNHLQYQAPWDGYLEVLDTDGDGLADQDARLAMDETRFGTNASVKDSDNDGLEDLAEYIAGIHFSTDPSQADTDADGQYDGLDPYPLTNFSPTLKKTMGTVVIDGILQTAEEWQPLVSEPVFSTIPALSLEVYATWDANYLYFAFESSELLKYYIGLDASGEDGTHTTAVKFTSGNYTSGDRGINDLSFSDVYNEEAFLVVRADGSQVYLKNVPIVDSSVTTVSTGGVHRTEVRIPHQLPPGRAWAYAPSSAPSLPTLAPFQVGDRLGMEFYARKLSEAGASNDASGWEAGARMSMFETYHFYDTQLTERATGSLTLTKAVTGAPTSFDNPDFTINVNCTDNAFDQNVVLKDGQSQTITGIPDGTDCTISEPTKPPAPANYKYAGVTPTSITISAGTTTTRTVTNTLYGLGTYTVTKQLTGGPLGFVSPGYSFQVLCDGVFPDGLYHVDENITLTAGQSKTYTEVPTGVQCSATETGIYLPPSGYMYGMTSMVPSGQQTIMTGVTTSITITNTLNAVGTPTVNLSIIKTADRSAVVSGDTIIYTLTLTNSSSTNATGVVVTDLLPGGVTYVECSTTGSFPDGACTSAVYNSGTGIWTAGTVSGNGTKTLKIKVTAN